MAIVKVKDIELGCGRPKICVPVTAHNTDELKASLAAMKDAEFDLIEWRADKYDVFDDRSLKTSEDGLWKNGQSVGEAVIRRNFDGDKLEEAAALIRAAFPDKPVIFTVRTSRDMEDFAISDVDYTAVNTFAADNKLGDIIDIEYSRGSEVMQEMADVIHAAGLKFIASRHIAKSTPDTEAMTEQLMEMQKTDADIVKLAVMPQSPEDVLKLMSATLYVNEHGSGTPIISMSMGRLGAVSRISGSLTGSCLTFGTVGAASAPGQIECGSLRQILDVLRTDHA